MRTIDETLQAIENHRGILITPATMIVYLAFGYPKSYFVPGQYWRRESSMKLLDDL